jgi:hypothetical protein
LVAGHTGHRYPLFYSLVPLILRDNWNDTKIVLSQSMTLN